MKQVYFIRHGESESNILFDQGKKKEARLIHDPQLSDRGRRQASKLAKDALLEGVLAQADEERAPVLVVTSPLRRALQTLQGGLGGWLARCREAGAPVRVEPRPDVQEHGTGDYLCDQGRPKSVLLEEFGSTLPGLRLDTLPEDWYRRPKDFRSEEVVAARLLGFSTWIQQQAEAIVIVVGHQNVFFSLLETDFTNGEVRLFGLDCVAGQGPPTRSSQGPRWQAVWPPPPPGRSSLICCSSRCNYLVHSNPDFGAFCCIVCYEGGGHGERCERRQPRPGCVKIGPDGSIPWDPSPEAMREALAAFRLRCLELGGARADARG